MNIIEELINLRNAHGNVRIKSKIAKRFLNKETKDFLSDTNNMSVDRCIDEVRDTTQFFEHREALRRCQ